MGHTKLISRLQTALHQKSFYEAHQLLKVLNFRSKTQDERMRLEELLQKCSYFFLEEGQVESGSDISVMLVKLYRKDDVPVTQERVDVLIRLLKIMPAVPERSTFLFESMEWVKPTSAQASSLHEAATDVYIDERAFPDAWRHILRVEDPTISSRLLHTLVEAGKVPLKERELAVCNIVLSYLTVRKIKLAEDTLRLLMQELSFHQIPPVLNGLRYLIESIKMNDLNALKTVRVLYASSFKRDPRIQKLISGVQMAIFKDSGRGNAASSSRGIFPLIANSMCGNSRRVGGGEFPSITSNKRPALDETNQLD